MERIPVQSWEVSYTELGGTFGPIQAISDFIYLISAVVSEQTVQNFTGVGPLVQ